MLSTGLVLERNCPRIMVNRLSRMSELQHRRLSISRSSRRLHQHLVHIYPMEHVVHLHPSVTRHTKHNQTKHTYPHPHRSL